MRKVHGNIYNQIKKERKKKYKKFQPIFNPYAKSKTEYNKLPVHHNNKTERFF